MRGLFAQEPGSGASGQGLARAKSFRLRGVPAPPMPSPASDEEPGAAALRFEGRQNRVQLQRDGMWWGMIPPKARTRTDHLLRSGEGFRVATGSRLSFLPTPRPASASGGERVCCNKRQHSAPTATACPAAGTAFDASTYSATYPSTSLYAS